MAGDEDYIAGKRPDRIYFSREFPVGKFPAGNTEAERPARFISRVLESGEREGFVEVKGEAVVRLTPSGRQQIKAIFYVDTREIESLTLQRFSADSGKPHQETAFTLRGDEIRKLLEVASLVRSVMFGDQDKLRIDESDLEQYTLTKAAARALAKADLDLVVQLAEHEVTEKDVVALAYRKSQLEVFRRMLAEPGFFAGEKERLAVQRDEDVWQLFFERNTWVFGYGLFYVFTSEFGEKKLEQVVAGYSVVGAGKRVDALLRTRGLVSSLCFVEIKTHLTPLLEGSAYRPETWAVSRELTRAIAQVQKTVLSAETAIGQKLEARDPEGSPTGELAFLLRPRSVVVAGMLGEFRTENGVNDTKFTSFEMFRRNVGAPEIITYDELYERARFIVEAHEADRVGQK